MTYIVAPKYDSTLIYNLFLHPEKNRKIQKVRDGHTCACFAFRVAFRCDEIFEDFSKISAPV